MRQVEALLNVISSAGKINEYVSQLQTSLQRINMSEGIDKSKIFRFVFKWLANKLDHLLSKGLQLSEIEFFSEIG